MQKRAAFAKVTAEAVDAFTRAAIQPQPASTSAKLTVGGVDVLTRAVVHPQSVPPTSA
jgi:hypothetical protein